MLDPATWRPEFPTAEQCTYLVSHSLGAMPRRAREHLARFADEWTERGVRAWSEGWWEIGRKTGNLLAPTLGVAPDTISMHQNVSVAQAIIASCFAFDGPRRRIVISALDFPTNGYVFEAFRRYGAEVVVVPSDDPVRVDTARFLDAVDDRTLLVPFSYVVFKSAHLQDARAIVERAHRAGAHVIADVYQAAGTVPLRLADLGVDFAVGGSVKWLCGGPGAGYLYVRPDLAPALTPAVTGWAAHARPFLFEPAPMAYADAPERFQSGTPNVPALYAARAGYEIVAEVGVEAIRAHSLALTRRIIDHAQARGYPLHTPTADAERGGTVTLGVAAGDRVAPALIARNVIVDYRPGAGIRMAPHFYTTREDVDRALAVLDELVEQAAKEDRADAHPAGFGVRPL
jgi:kynureninase